MRRVLLVSVLLLFSAVLSCSSSDDGGDPPAPPDSSPTPTNPTPAPPGTGEIFVSGTTRLSVLVFPSTGTGEIQPARELHGGNTLLTAPVDLVVDRVNNELLVANSDGTIVVHARTAIGNAAPLRVLAGPATQLTGLVAIAISNARGELYALTATSLHVYLLAATGNTPPIRSITGLNTHLNSIFDLAFDAQTEEFFIAGAVAGGRVLAFPRTASGNATPVRTLATSCGVPVRVDVDPAAGELFVICFSNAGAGTPGGGGGSSSDAVVFARNASGSALPIRQQQGSIDALSVDPLAGEICLVDGGRRFISTLATSFQGNVRRITGSTTVLNDVIQPGSIVNVVLVP